MPFTPSGQGRKNSRRPAALTNELGLSQTPPAGEHYFQVTGSGERVLFIGLGPEPKLAVRLAAGLESRRRAAVTEVGWVDSPLFRQGMPCQTPPGLPPDWREYSEEETRRALAAPEGWTFILYTPGLRLFPSWYGPLFGAAWAGAAAGPESARPGLRSVTLPGSEHELLHRELRLALEDLGLEVRVWEGGQRPPGDVKPSLPPEDRLGDLFLSVNFRGLDAFGAAYHYLRARGVRVAVWCVDNPWHLLTALRAPYWLDLPLFVTDDSFLPGLRAHGAKQAHHLPLAVCPEMLLPLPAGEPPAFTQNLAPLVFVGRTAFPGRDKFFAAQHLEPSLLAEALHSLDDGCRPDFLYWTRRLGLTRLWPGQAARLAGLAAETFNRQWRRLCVKAALRPAGPGVTIFGDPGWREALAEPLHNNPPPDLRPPLDYYTQLPSLYAQAALILNATSLLLPGGLNQRHFDVWAAGGVLLTDNSPGLKIFPRELTEPITYARPVDIAGRAAELLADAGRLNHLQNDWRYLLGTEHTYRQRLEKLLEIVQP